MSIFIKPKIRWNQECLAIELSWQPTKEEELVLHNFAWEAHHQGTVDERERIIKLLADSFDWNDSVRVDRDELIALITGETND